MTRVIVNGVARELGPGDTLATLVNNLDLKPDRVAVELDRRIIRPSEWDRTEIRDGAEIEIVHFVGGG